MTDNTRHPLLTDQELNDLAEIDRLLHEANEHSLAGDGHCKSSDGSISVDFGTHWNRLPDEPRNPVAVDIYSYLLGPHRSHRFDNTAQALEVVRQWHRRELAYDYTTEEYTSPEVEHEDDLYLAIEDERQREFAKAMRDFERLMEDGGPDDD